MARNIEDPIVDLLTYDFTAKCISVILLITGIPYLIKIFYENYNYICRSYFSWCCNSTDSNQHCDLIVPSESMNFIVNIPGVSHNSTVLPDKWEKPTCDQGILSGYELCYVKSSVGDCVNNGMIVNITDPDQLSYTINDFTINTKLKERTGADLGEPTNATFTTDEDENDKTCKQYEDEPLQTSSAQNEELLEYCIPTLPHYTGNIVPVTHSEMVWDHGELYTSHSLHINQNYNSVLSTELVILCNHMIHVSIDEIKLTSVTDNGSIDTSDLIIKTLSLPPEQPPENVYTTNSATHEIGKFGMTVLQLINILLCMLMRHLICKDMFSSMFMMQRISKDKSTAQFSESEVFTLADNKALNILLSFGANLKQIKVLWGYLLEEVGLCYTSILLVLCYFCKSACRLSKIVSSDDALHIKELPQAVVAISKQYWLRTVSLKSIRFSLWLLKAFEIFSLTSFSGVLRIKENNSMFVNITLHNDGITPCLKSYIGHYIAIVFFIMWSEILINCANHFVTISHFGLTGAISILVDKKNFNGLLYNILNKAYCVLESMFWLILPDAVTLLNDYKYNSALLHDYNCGAQFRTSLLQKDVHNNFSVFTRVLDNWCDNILCYNSYATKCCMNSWPTLRKQDVAFSLYNSSFAGTHYDEIHTNIFALSTITIVIVAFVILCWLLLKSRKNCLNFPLIKKFQSMKDVLNLKIINATVNCYHKLVHIKHKLFGIVQQCCNSMHLGCLGFKRIILSPYTVESPCTAYGPPLRDIIETLQPYSGNIIDSIPDVPDDDDEFLVCEEEGHDQNYSTQVDTEENILHLCEPCEGDAIEGAELVVGITWFNNDHNVTISYQTSEDIIKCINDIPLNISMCDDCSHKVVSPYECDDGLTLEPHTQAEYRNADHQFLQDENGLVTGNTFSYFSPLDNIVDINVNHREFCQSPAEDDSIEISPSQEQANQSDHDLDNDNSCLLGNTKGSECDDSDCDDDNIECNGRNERYCGVAECHSFNTSSDDLVVCSKAEEIVWSSNSDGGNEVLLTGTYTISEVYGSDQVVLSLIDQVLCIQYTHRDAERSIGGNHVNRSKIINNQPSMLENNVNSSNIDQFNKQTVSLAACHFPSTSRTEQRRCQLITSIDDTHVGRYGALRDGVYITPEGQNIIRKDAVNTVGLQMIREKLTQLQQIRTVGPQYTTSYDTKFVHELVVCEENGHYQNCWMQEDTKTNVLHLCEPCKDDAIEDAKFVASIISCAWFNDDHNITTSHQTSEDIIKYFCINDIPINISSCSHKVVSPYECDGLTLEPHTQAEYRNADHQFSCDENDLVTGSSFSYFPLLDNVVDINVNRREFHRSPAEDDSIEVSPSQEQTNQSDHDLDNNKDSSFENIEGSEDDDSDCDDDNIECNGYEKYCGVAECQSFNTGCNELVVCSKAEEIVWSSNSDGDNELLLTGTYTISEVYGSDQVVLSLIDQVLCIHTCSDTSRPIGGEHVNKPKVSCNQPSVFEDNVNRSNIDQFNQQTVSLEASHFPSVARTEQRRHQQITSADDTRVERDGPSRNDAYITPEGQSIIAKDATRTEQRRHQPITSTNDTHVERDGALRDDVTPEGQSIITNDAIATVGPQIIREKPTQSLQIPTVGPQYTTSYDTKFSGNPTMPYEEVKQRSKAKTTFLQHEVEDRSQQALKQTTVQNAHPLIPQLTNQSAASNTTTSKPKALPKRSCMVAGSTQYPLTPNLLAHPHMDHFFVKERKEIKPGHFLAKLVLQHHYLIMHNNNDDINETATAAQQSQAAAIVADSATAERDGAVTKRQHFPMNINRAGYIVFSSDLTRFTGDIKYPLPGRKATAVKIGKGGNGFVFSIFHNSKEYAVKKTVYRPNEIRVHSQLAHANLVNLEAVLIGEEHENHKGKFYAFYFMNKLDMDFRSVISTKEHGCLKHLKLQLSDQRNMWEVVMVNVKYVLRSVLKALDYMHNQGLVHRDVKASNILLKMNCQCTKPLMCACPQKYLVKLGDFDSSTTVPGHGLRIEPHQMIRYASVLPLGTMGYRAPEVSMHLVISGPYEVLYTTAVDIWSFGCLLLNILIGKCGPLKQRGEASLLLSVQNQPYSENLYNKIIKVKELQKYYSDIPELIDLVRKCLQVEVHCRPTAKQLLQLDILQC